MLSCLGKQVSWPITLRSGSLRTWNVSGALVICLVIIFPTCDVNAQNPHAIEKNVKNIVGHEECARCHLAEVATWKETPHSLTFEKLHRDPNARVIAKKMGAKSIKRSKLCISCHYTQQANSNRVKAISGVSCESCHGPAKEWIDLHNDYGGTGVSKQSESAAHKQERITTCLKLGMRNPKNLYLVARSCFDCHTVPQEELVNVGGHVAGSQQFELVAWSQGMVRHNYLRTNGEQNQASSLPRLRVMYVVGMLTDLEYSIRSLANAKRASQFAFSNAVRIARLRKKVHTLEQKCGHKTITVAWKIAAKVELKLENQASLLAAADQLAALTHEFAEVENGEALSAVDSFLPTPDQYK